MLGYIRHIMLLKRRNQLNLLNIRDGVTCTDFFSLKKIVFDVWKLIVRCHIVNKSVRYLSWFNSYIAPNRYINRRGYRLSSSSNSDALYVKKLDSATVSLRDCDIYKGKEAGSKFAYKK